MPKQSFTVKLQPLIEILTLIEEKTLNTRQQTKKDNKDRRNSMLVKVFSFNLQKNKLSKAKEKYLSLLFREAKWYYNYLINLSQQQTVDNYGNLVYCYNLFNFKTNQKFIKRHNPKFDCFEDYELKASSFSNQEKMKAAVRVDKAVMVLLNKLKSQNCKALSYNPTPEATVFRQW